jgi:molecular chaperone DnaK
LIGRYFFSEEVKKAQAICSYEIIEGPSHGVRIQMREEAFSLPEVSAMVLREMKQVAEANLGEQIVQAVITVPAYFNDNQRQATKDAGKIAGLEVLRILNEPTAAALAYGFGKGLDQRVAVYDLGGGTFDISILEIGKDIFEVLATCGDTFLGGDDFDDRIIDLVADEFVANEGINIRNDPYAFEKLKVAAEAAKCGLSTDDEVTLRIPDVIMGDDGRPRSIERKLTTEEFNGLVMDLIMRTFKVCDEALQQADLTVRDLDGVILVGGPTRLPIIRQSVTDYFQRDPRADVDPDEVVAMGAAIHANSLVTEGAESFLLDITPLDLRIGVAGGMAEAVLERNTPVPIEQTRSFTTFTDYQESVKIRVYQGDSREADQNEMLGEFEFSGFKKARRGEVTIDVTFEINADGIVNVKACDPDTGAQTTTCITLSSGLSDEELESILEDNPTGRVASSGPGDPITAKAASPAKPAPSGAPSAAPALATDEDDALDLLGDGRDDDLYEELELDSNPRPQAGFPSDPGPMADGAALPASGGSDATAPAAAAAADVIDLAEPEVELLTEESDAILLAEDEIVELADDDELFDRGNTNLSAGLEDD